MVKVSRSIPQGQALHVAGLRPDCSAAQDGILLSRTGGAADFDARTELQSLPACSKRV